MKKVMILFAVAVVFGLAIPKSAVAMKVQNDIVMLQDKEVKYDTVAVEQLPEAVSKSISEAYSGYTIDKAFKGDDGTYKVNISKEAVRHVLFFDDKGKLIKSEQATSEK